MSTDLIKSISIDNLLAQRAAILERLIKVQQLANEGNQIIRAIDLPHTGFSCLISNEHRFSYGDCLVSGGTIEAAQRRLDTALWDKLINDSGIKTYMDGKSRNEWNDAICNKKVPPFEKENILATFSNLQDNRHKMMEDGILECFKRLSWDYKTNSPVKFGKRIIINRLFSVFGGTGANAYLHLVYDTANHLTDLDRFFHVLDEKPELDHRNDIREVLNIANRDGGRQTETEYFHIKWFVKGTGHITFKRQDLVAQCNKILAKHYPNALPPA